MPMENAQLDAINNAVIALQQANSEKQLYKAVVEESIKLLQADYGKLFLYEKDRIKKMYSSSPSIKKATLIKSKKFKKLLNAKTLFSLNKDQLVQLQIKNFPPEIQLVLVLPLTHSTRTLGFLLLYFSNKKADLSPLETASYTLFGRSIVLALTKAKLQEESRKALEIRDRFISLASHELRTPLTSIHGYIQLLHARMTKQKTDTVEARWIKELYIESLRMTTLVKELLDVNRIKQGQFAFVFSEVQLLEVVNRALDHYRLTDENHPFIFDTDLEKQQTMIVGDFDKLVEMVSGILGNAVKFSKPGEKIMVQLTNEQGMISLVVRDKGKGISKKDLNAIFEGFYKSDHASHLEGMGVGLLLARHIVDNHRGKLKVQSKENNGTKVEVMLPSIKTSTN
jgi:signal transduction histidine kinase